MFDADSWSASTGRLQIIESSEVSARPVAVAQLVADGSASVRPGASRPIVVASSPVWTSTVVPRLTPIVNVPARYTKLETSIEKVVEAAATSELKSSDWAPATIGEP